tara:strand:+ start:1429 stop:1899 length:471 start_codon:yes stop_codon:yes gene_type:complete
MAITYKRILNEYNKYGESVNKDINFNYKIIVLNNEKNLYKSEIIFINNSKKYTVNIYYDRSYPFKPPSKIQINGININNYYKNIMEKNNDILDKCLCCESLLCFNNWHVNKTIKDIMIEIIKIIDYSNLKVYRILLKKICNKYTDQSLDYLDYYLK